MREGSSEETEDVAEREKGERGRESEKRNRKQRRAHHVSTTLPPSGVAYVACDAPEANHTALGRTRHQRHLCRVHGEVAPRHAARGASAQVPRHTYLCALRRSNF